MSKQRFARSMVLFVQSAPQWVCAADGTGLRLRAGGLLPNVSFCLRLNAALCIAADAALEFDHAVKRAAKRRKGNGQKCNAPFHPEHFLNAASFVTLFQRCLLDYALKGYGFASNSSPEKCMVLYFGFSGYRDRVSASLSYRTRLSVASSPMSTAAISPSSTMSCRRTNTISPS